jgi:signal transduction histidine kinase
LAQYYFEKDKNKAAAFYEQAKSNTTLEAFTDRYYLDHVSLLEELIELYEDYQYGTRVKQDYLAYIENKNKSEQALRILEYKKGYEYEIEAQTNEMEVANLKREKQRLILFFSAIGCTLILGFSLFLLYLNLRRQRIKNDILSKRSLELINSNTKLKNKNKELERLAYITSHDLKTPLLSIVGFSKVDFTGAKKVIAAGSYRNCQLHK